MKKLIGSDLAKVAAIMSALALAACGTDPDDDHPEAVKVELRLSGQVIASYVAETGRWTGELEVDVGEETAHISVRFLDEDDQVIDGEDVALKVEVEDESIAEFEQDKPGDFGGHLHGKSEGETDVTFILLHNDHEEFKTQPVHAHVHDDDAHEPAGVALVLGGNVIAYYDGATRSWTSELEVDVGEETAHITVLFVDEEGDAIQEDDTYLEVDVEDESIAEWEQDTPGEFGGHLHGVSEGETDIVFKLMHGEVGQGHADYTTTAVHAHVHGG